MRLPLDRLGRLARQARALHALTGRQRGGFWWLCVVLLAASLIEILFYSSLLPLAEQLLGGGGGLGAGYFAWVRSWYGRVSPDYRTHASLLVVLALGVIRELAQLGTMSLTSTFMVRVVNMHRTRIFDHFMGFRMRFFDEGQGGDLMNTVIAEVKMIPKGLKHLLQLFERTAHFLIMLGLMFLLSWKLVLLLIVFGVANILLTRIVGRRVQGMSEEALTLRSEMNVAAHESLGNVRSIKLLGAARRMTEGFARVASTSEWLLRREQLLSSWLAPLSGLLGLLATGTVIWIAVAFPVFAGQTGSVAPLLVFLVLMSRVIPLFSELNGIYVSLMEASPSLRKVQGLLEPAPELFERGGSVRRSRLLTHEVRFEGVGMEYPGKPGVLDGVTFRVPRGKTVAVVGVSGAGKTSLLDLIPRLYDTSSGRILVDGTDLREFDLEWLRSRIGVVSQELSLFNLSVRDNIALGRPGASEEEVVEAARRGYAHEFILELPQGYDTLVGERGVKLSGGQRQRIALAQVFLRDPEILVLDEAMSALDAKSEEVVQESIRRLSQDRTVIVVSHRLASIRRADFIVVLKEGRVEEAGPWEDLLARRGEFWALYQRQMLADEGTAVARALDEGK